MKPRLVLGCVINDLFDLLDRNRAFLQRTHDTATKFFFLERHPAAVMLDDTGHIQFSVFIGRKTLSTFQAFTSSADLVTFVG